MEGCNVASLALKTREQLVSRVGLLGKDGQRYLPPDWMLVQFLPRVCSAELGCSWEANAFGGQVFLRQVTPWLAGSMVLSQIGVHRSGTGRPMEDATENLLDRSSSMGCWAKAVDGGDLDASNLPLGRFISFPLPAQHVSSKNMIRIRPTWLGEAHSHNLYISYRQARAGDSGLDPELDGKVLLHQILKTEDVRYTGASSRHGYTELLLGHVIAPGGKVVLTPFQLCVTAGAAAGGSEIKVQIYRHNQHDKECP
ncbi:hypothetical protein HYH03_016400 [Edaphochlamys debaryana]|uniref:Peptidase M11 gametolysin domain-containing protein n=1 Tax=Edaphochlamys debaryana TaxID=47281 RepID=A0A835XIS4_9CHLO|nr:hypothetical protein HYH03_016400 [Edaphochlamys debaryana]|eukprot:KAG2484833.1 hypothetical protein HYH03_016400 [Edaphochlamys debaryana]